MFKKKPVIIAFASIISVLLVGCKNKESYVKVTGPYMTGKLAKKEYNAYLGAAPDTLDSTKSQNQQNLQHIANFSATLLMNDTNSVLRKSLATKATKKSDNKEFRFQIRSGEDKVKWVTNKGDQYVYTKAPQFVELEDFVTTAQIILDYRTESEIYYMYTLFINHAWEYYCCTMVKALAVNGEFSVTNRLYPDHASEPRKTYTLQDIRDEDTYAEAIMNMVYQYSGEDWYDGNTDLGHEGEITGDDIKDIKAFKRVGVKVETNEAGEKELVYSLNQAAPFFPTMLTYTPYMPINSNFYKSHKKAYGSTAENILYCGPYLCTEFNSTTVTYERNKHYFYAIDENGNPTVHVDKVKYKVLDQNVNYKQLREAFDRGEVDGFSLNKQDEIGWKKYITGEDGKGTIQEPVSPYVNSRELNTVDFTYHFVLNCNRDFEHFNEKQSTAWTHTPYKGNVDAIKKQIENTNNALKIYELRKLVLDGIDLEKFNEQYQLDENNDQYQINTFTPRGYVYDDGGKDYVEYVYEEYANKKGITRDEAYEILKPQQIKGVNMTQDEVKQLAEEGKKAIELYNAAHKDKKITLPIYVEYNASSGLSSESKVNEDHLIQSWNQRVNCCAVTPDMAEITGLPLCPKNDKGVPEYPFMKMIANEPSDQSTFTDITNNGKYTIYTGWGWKGDYADPLTYMHCYVTKGEMSKQSGNTDYFNDYRLLRNQKGEVIKNDSGDMTLVSIETDATTNQWEKHMFAAYNSKVKEARRENESLATRFKLFAEAEVMLLDDLKIMRPSSMHTQGWVASVSRAAGYEAPESPYGVSDQVLIGIWVLKDVPTAQERQDCRDRHDKTKAEMIKENGGKTMIQFDALY